MTDLLGPANAVNSVTTEPADARIFGSSDTFFKDCSSSTAQDGTAIGASWLNGILQQIRAFIRGAGITLDNTNDSMLLQAAQALIAAANPNWTIAGGTADALTATYTPAITALTDGKLCFVRATSANATATPTFAPNGLTAHPITKNGGGALTPGDIVGNLAEIILRYNLASTRWELLNPATPNQPTGSVVAFAGPAAPAGYLICDGSSQLRAGALAALFAVVGTTYGSADGSHFNLPDLRGRVIASLDSGGSGRITVAGGNFDGTVLGGSGGLQNETLTQAQLPAVAPTFTGDAIANVMKDSSLVVQNARNDSVGFNAVNGAGVTAGSITPSGTISNLGSGNAHPNVQPTLMMNYIIKT